MIKYFARSEIADPDRLRVVADALERQFAKKRPTRFLRVGGGPFMAVMDFGDRKEVWTDDAIECHALRLPDLRCFQIEKSPHINDVRLWSNSTSAAAYEQWRNWFNEHGQTMPRAMLSTYLIAAGRMVADPNACDIVEEADYTVAIGVGGERGAEVFWRYWQKPGDTPADFQKFFRTCISGCGLEKEIRIEEAEKGFRLLSDRLKLKFGQAKWGDYDPLSAFIQAPDLSTAGKWCDLTRSALDTSFFGTRIHLECREAQYVEYRNIWNSLSRGWGMRFDGGYVPGFDPFTAPLPAAGEESASYPLMNWEAGGDDLFYQCDVVAAPEGRYLELLTNVASEKKVLERLKKVDVGNAFRVAVAQC